MLTKRSRVLIACVWAAVVGCSGKSSLSAKPDGGLPDSAADVARAPEPPPDADLAPDLTSTPDRQADTVSAPDLAADVRVTADVSSDAAGAPDRPVDATNVIDLALEGGPDLLADGVNASDRVVDTVDTRLADEGTSEANGDSSYGDACGAVANLTFLSVEEHECGLTPTGVATCQWSIAFTDNGATRQLSWRHSDVSETLVYRCDGYTITTAVVSGTQPTYKGTYEPATGILTWDGFNYTKVIR